MHGNNLGSSRFVILGEKNGTVVCSGLSQTSAYPQPDRMQVSPPAGI